MRRSKNSRMTHKMWTWVTGRTVVPSTEVEKLGKLVVKGNKIMVSSV